MGLINLNDRLQHGQSGQVSRAQHVPRAPANRVNLLKEVLEGTHRYTGRLANTNPKMKGSFTFLAVQNTKECFAAFSH